MAEVVLTQDTLTVGIGMPDVFVVMRRRLTYSLANVAGANVDPELAAAGPQGMRIGMYVPGLAAIGTFVGSDGRVFWDVVNPSLAIVIYLDNLDFMGLVIEVKDPEETCQRINGAVAAYRRAQRSSEGG